MRKKVAALTHRNYLLMGKPFACAGDAWAVEGRCSRRASARRALFASRLASQSSTLVASETSLGSGREFGPVGSDISPSLALRDSQTRRRRYQSSTGRDQSRVARQSTGASEVKDRVGETSFSSARVSAVSSRRRRSLRESSSSAATACRRNSDPWVGLTYRRSTYQASAAKPRVARFRLGKPLLGGAGSGSLRGRILGMRRPRVA